MATTYTGSAAGGPLTSAIQISIPQDGVDTLGVSTVNSPLQKTADYLEALRTGTGQIILPFSATIGNAASTNYFLYAGTGSLQTTGAAAHTPSPGASPTTEYWFPFPVKIRAYALNTQQAVVGGTATLFVDLSGVQTALPVSSGGATISNILGSPISVAATTPPLALVVTNGVGVTQGYGRMTIYLFATLN